MFLEKSILPSVRLINAARAVKRSEEPAQAQEAWRIFIQQALAIGIDDFEGSELEWGGLKYLPPERKGDLLRALDHAEEVTDREEKASYLINSSVRDYHDIGVWDASGSLVAGCVLSYLLEQSPHSFKRLQVIKLDWYSEIPECPEAKRVCDYYRPLFEKAYKDPLWQLAKKLQEAIISASQEKEILWQILIQRAIEADKEAFLEKDPEGNLFLDRTNGTFKGEFLQALDRFTRYPTSKEDEEKVQAVFFCAIAQNSIALWDEENTLTKTCVLRYFLEEPHFEFFFKYLKNAGFQLTSPVSGCPLKKTFFDYYYQLQGKIFCSHIAKTIDYLSTLGVDRWNILSLLVTSKASLFDIGCFFRTGIAIGSHHLDIKALWEYVLKQEIPSVYWGQERRKELHSLLNTIVFFEKEANDLDFFDCLKEPLYPLTFCDKGKTVLHVLLEKKLEQACIGVLEKNEENIATKVWMYGSESLFHFCVEKGYEHLLTYLIGLPLIDMDCINDQGKSPFLLAVALEKQTLARILLEAGATRQPLLSRQEQTALHHVVLQREVYLLERCQKWGLLEKMSVKEPNREGYSALFYAAQQEDLAMYHLLQHCQDVAQAQGEDLWNAVRKADREGINLCLRLGVSVNQLSVHCFHKALKDCTPLEFAQVHKREAIAHQLQEKGGHSRGSNKIQALRDHLKGRKLDSEEKPTNELVECYRREKRDPLILRHPFVFKVGGLLLAGLCLYAWGIFSTSPLTGGVLAVFNSIIFGIGIAYIAGHFSFGKKAFCHTEEENYWLTYEVERQYALDLARGLHERKHQHLIHGLPENFRKTSHPLFYSTGIIPDWAREHGTRLKVMRKQIALLETVAKRKYVESPVIYEERTLRKARYSLF